MNVKGTQGKIRWRSITGYPAPKVMFDVLKDGRILHKRHIQSTRNLLALPQDILGMICEYTSSLPKSIIVDLGSRASTLPVFPLLDFARMHPRLLGVVVSSIYLSNTFTLVTNVHSKRTTSRDLSCLSHWLRMDALGILDTPTLVPETIDREVTRKAGKRLARAVARERRRKIATETEEETEIRMEQWKVDREVKQKYANIATKTAQRTATKDTRTILRWIKAVHFEFRSNIRERTSLESLRISIVGFLQTTTWDEPFTATIKCALTCHRKGGRIAYYENTFTLRYVQLNAFIILSHVLEARPSMGRNRCPNVYINGFGIAVEITYRDKNRGPRFHRFFRATSNWSRTEERGKYYAKWLKHLVPIDDGRQDHEKTDDELRPLGSLIRVWDDLRIALWGEGLRAAW